MKLDTGFKMSLSQDLYFIRGVAIVFVVAGHVIGYNRDYGMRQLYNSDLSILGWICDFINSFHMPVFFMASGIAFAIFSNKDISYVKFARSKLEKLLIPLICWSPIYFAFQALYKGYSFSLLDIIKSIIYPYEIFWFIHVLIFATILSFICFKLFKSQLIYFGVSILLFIICSYSNNDLIYWYWHWNIFYASGVFLGNYLYKIHLKIETLPLSVILLIGSSCLAIMLIARYFLDLSTNGFDFLRLINGPTAFLLMYIMLNPGKKISFLPKTFNHLKQSFETHIIEFGKTSMVIYLFHGYFTRGTGIFVLKIFGRPEPILYFTLVTSVGVLGSVILYKFLHNKNKIFMYSIGGSK